MSNAKKMTTKEFSEKALKRMEAAVKAIGAESLQQGEFFLVIVGRASMPDGDEGGIDLQRGCITNLPKACIPQAVQGLEHGMTARGYEQDMTSGDLRTLDQAELDKLKNKDAIDRLMLDIENGRIDPKDLN